MENKIELKYRKDGWPLCPKCGDDELMSLNVSRINFAGDGILVLATDPMLCLVCRWTGQVPPVWPTT